LSTTPEVSVVIPLTDARGDSVEHLRTWTHEQTHPRDRYQIVIVSDGEQPEVDREVVALLAPHDRFEAAGGASLIELWSRAAEIAAADWLLFTENHVQGEPNCIENAIAGITASPDLEAASLEHGHIAPDTLGELGARWFDDVYREWFQPGSWTRLNLAGFVLRRDALRSAGGLEARYGLFAAPLLSARLDERGAHVGHLLEARILHIQCDEIGEHHEFSADYAMGESEARTTLPPQFAEHYFGYQSLIWNRCALEPRSARRSVLLLARELVRSLSRRGADFRWILRSLAAHLPEATAGIRPRLWHARLAFRWSERVATSRWFPRERRYRSYLRAQDRVVRLAQLSWIADRDDDEAPALGPGAHPIESVGEGTIVGVHGLEMHGGRRFRWSGPVVTLRAESGGPDLLRIDTGGLRGSPLDCVAAAFLGSRRLRGDQLRKEGNDLVVTLPGGAVELILLCRPLPTGAAEPRELGLPVFSVHIGEGSPVPESSAERKPAAVV
jgi:hypothetical protein